MNTALRGTAAPPIATIGLNGCPPPLQGSRTFLGAVPFCGLSCQFAVLVLFARASLGGLRRAVRVRARPDHLAAAAHHPVVLLSAQLPDGPATPEGDGHDEAGDRERNVPVLVERPRTAKMSTSPTKLPRQPFASPYKVSPLATPCAPVSACESVRVHAARNERRGPAPRLSSLGRRRPPHPPSRSSAWLARCSVWRPPT